MTIWTSVKMHVQVFVRKYVFRSLGCRPRSRIAGSVVTLSSRLRDS